MSIPFRDRQDEMIAARTWQTKLTKMWHGVNPLYYPNKDEWVRLLALAEGLPDGDRLAFDRIDLIRMATRNVMVGHKDKPDRRAFVSLALFDYLDDLEAGDTAMLPYQLAYSWFGHPLYANGLPGGRARFKWPWSGTVPCYSFMSRRIT